MEKQALALVKALNYFKVYILHSHIIAFVPHTVFKDILGQDPDGKRGNWIANILEYDLEIKPTKLIKGQGLAKLMVESNFKVLDMNMVDALEEIEEFPTPFTKETFTNSPWYADTIYVLLYLNAPPYLLKTKARFVKQKALKYYKIDGVLYWKNAIGILIKCLLEKDAGKNMHEMHEGECGGKLNWKTIANKILRSSYYWPTLFLDTHKLVMSCHKCQIFDGRRKLLPLPLKPISVETPFQQWGLDFIGKIHPPSSA